MSRAAPSPDREVEGQTTKPFVFLGPSLPLPEARRILDAHYLPPASMGDVYRLTITARPRVIAIIDGLFEQTPAVWHKEILFALSKGIRVLGGSSMGALRAAELAAFGMEGIGDVFEAFVQGRLEDDDEVAVAHAPAADGYRSLSDAMVNLRAGLRTARDAGKISGRTHDRLVAAAKDLYYPDRSWSRLFTAAAGLDIPAIELGALRDQIARARPDVKRADAIRLLERLATESARGAADAGDSPKVAFDFEPTFFWDQMILHESAVEDAPGSSDLPGGGGAPGAVTAVELQRHLRIDRSRARDPLCTALLLFLADEQATRREIGSAPTPLADLEEPRPPAAGSELLSPRARADLERGERAIQDLLEALSAQINRRLPAALARLGRLQSTLIEVRRKQVILQSMGLRAASPADAGLTLDDLLLWYERRFGPVTGAPEEHALSLGFASLEEFAAEVVLEYLAEPDAVKE